TLVSSQSCEPSNKLPCARFIPQVSYEFIPGDPSETLTSINTAQRVQFADDESSFLAPLARQAVTLAHYCNYSDGLASLRNFIAGQPSPCWSIQLQGDGSYVVDPILAFLSANPLPVETAAQAIRGGPGPMPSIAGEVDNLHQTSKDEITEPGV